MEHENLNTKKTIINFGLLLSFIGIAFSLMLYVADMQYEQGIAIQATQISILIIVVFFAVFQYKKDNNGYLKLSQALKIGTGVAFIGGAIGLLYFFIFSNFIEPDFLDKTFEITKQKALIENPSITAEQMDQSIEMQKKFAWISYPVILIFNLILGFVTGLIGGLIMKKENTSI